MTHSIDHQIHKLESKIRDIKGQLAALRRERPKELVQRYELLDSRCRRVTLAEMFDGKDRLILIHNMGKSCAFCTMWADGFAGLVPHLLSRAAFVVVSNDAPDAQTAFATSRGWPFAMYSAQETTFFRDMGFVDNDGWMPGVSVFERTANGDVYRVGSAEFGPGDNFCAVWHFFELLPEGIDGWEPRLQYSDDLVEVMKT